MINFSLSKKKKAIVTFTNVVQIFNSDQPTTSARPVLGLPEIYITVSEPSIEIVEVGSTIRFRCDARSRRNRVIMIDLFRN